MGGAKWRGILKLQREEFTLRSLRRSKLLLEFMHLEEMTYFHWIILGLQIWHARPALLTVLLKLTCHNSVLVDRSTFQQRSLPGRSLWITSFFSESHLFESSVIHIGVISSHRLTETSITVNSIYLKSEKWVECKHKHCATQLKFYGWYHPLFVYISVILTRYNILFIYTFM